MGYHCFVNIMTTDDSCLLVKETLISRRLFSQVLLDHFTDLMWRKVQLFLRIICSGFMGHHLRGILAVDEVIISNTFACWNYCILVS